MQTIQTKLRTGPDGMLMLRVPSGMADTIVHVIVVLQPVGDGPGRVVEAEAWRRFVAETSGSIEDPTFMRHPQGEYERRWEWE